MSAAAPVDLPASASGPADFWAGVPAEQLCRLSFAHFCELLSVTNARQRTFYEGQASRPNWSVRVLRQAIDSLLYECTILSRDQDTVLTEYTDAATSAPPFPLMTADLLHFLGLSTGVRISASATTILRRLKAFLLGLGRGFCFEAQSKRLTLDKKAFLVDLVFYHRILKCHFLVNARPTTRHPADTSYLNVCLRHYRKHERAPDDNPPVGLLLGARPAASRVSYPTLGNSSQAFARQQHALLPSEAELSAFFEGEEPS